MSSKKHGSTLISLFMILALVFALAGCSGDKKETTTEKPTEQSTEQKAEQSTEQTTEQTTAQTPETTAEQITEQATEQSAEKATVRIGAMSGPTAMGLVKLMDDNEKGLSENSYEFAELSTDPSAFVAPLSKGELDIAAVPANLSSVLYNNTDGGVCVLAINNLCVLNIVERGDSVNNLEDLKGKKLYATGQGAVPEYTLRHLLKQKGIDPDADLELQWCADTTEALSYINNDSEAIAMLPQPFVTAALAQVEDLRLAIDLNDAWNDLDNGCKQVTGVIVVRKAFAEENPEAVETFLKEYEASMNYTADDADGAAALIEHYGIVAKAPIAKKALPGCHLCFEKGSDMKNSLEGFLKILYDENAKSVGGNLPNEDFYYGIK